MINRKWKRAGLEMRNWILHSYRAKLMIAFLSVSFVALLLMGGVYYYRMYTGIEQNTRHNLEKLTERTVSTMELYMENIENEAWGMFSDKDFQIFVENMNNGFFEKTSYYRGKIEMQLRRNDIISLLAVYDLQGSRLQSVQLRIQDPVVAEREEARLIELGRKNAGTGVWQTVPLNEEGSRYALSYVQAIKKINNYSQKIVGVLRIDMEESAFSAMLSDLDPTGMNLFYIVDGEGAIIQASDPSRIGRNIGNLPWFQPGEYAEEAGLDKVTVAGKSQMTVYRHFGNQDWMLIGSIPMNNIMTEVQQAKQFMLWVGLFCLLTAALFAYLISGGVTRPLRELRERMKQVEMGNFKISVPVKTMDEIGVIGIRFNRMVSEIDHLVDKIYEVELLRKDAEIQALQLQINPHFLYNALEMIDSVASIEGQELISKVAQSLAKMFRYSISGAPFTTLHEEVEQVRHYLQIQKFRYEDRFSYDIHIEPSLAGARLPKLILQPLVENSIKHGIENRMSGGYISIDVRSLDDARLRIRVCDNGAELDGKQLLDIRQRLQEPSPSRSQGDRKSIGLDNVNRRLRLHYSGRAELSIGRLAAQAGTEVTLIVPVYIGNKEEELA